MARTTIDQHWPFRRLGHRLNQFARPMGDVLARGAIASIWDVAGHDLEFVFGSSDEIERAIHWTATSGVLVNLLIEEGFLDSTANRQLHWFGQSFRDFREIADAIPPPANRPKIPARMRVAVIERDGLICQICADAVDRGDVHIDHIKPLAAGGPTEINNLRVTHSLCNLRKSARWEP